MKISEVKDKYNEKDGSMYGKKNIDESIAMLYHAKLGNETIVEDYVTSVNLKKITKLSISVLTYTSMILTTISLFYIVSS